MNVIPTYSTYTVSHEILRTLAKFKIIQAKTQREARVWSIIQILTNLLVIIKQIM